MALEEFFEENGTLSDIVDFYKKQGLKENTSQILAIKKVMNMRDPQIQIHYLGMAAFLDSITHYKKFQDESEKYVKYFEEVLYDRPKSKNKSGYIAHLPKTSALVQRFIAARIKDEIYKFPPPNEVESPKGHKYNSFYEIFESRKEDSEKKLSKKELISRSINFVLNVNDENYKYMILGEEPYLHYLSFKRDFNPKNINLFLDVFDEACPKFKHIDQEEKEKGLIKILESSDKDTLMNKFISAKLRKLYFNKEEFEQIENYERYKRLEEDDYED